MSVSLGMIDIQTAGVMKTVPSVYTLNQYYLSIHSTQVAEEPL